MKSLIALILLIKFIQCFGFDLWRLYGFKQVNISETNQVQEWYNQKIDHFDQQNNVTFQQRYYVIDQYFDKSTKRVFLYTCGEDICEGATQLLVQLAAKYKALLVVLEHRYYGESQPFRNYPITNKRLKYLTVQNALEDLASFIRFINTEKYQIGNDAKWISIGGSYPGALSAWLRYKYPHLVVGALASSAVVNSILDYDLYDYQVAKSLLRHGKWCLQNYQEALKEIEKQLENPETNKQFKEQYNAESLTDLDLLEYISIFPSFFVQKGQSSDFCSYLKAEDVNERLKNLFKLLIKEMQIPPYSQLELYGNMNPYNQVRLWFYQVCTQMGLFQTAYHNPEMSAKSQQININYYKKQCELVFGIGTWPDTNNTNNQFGATLLRIPNLILTNGIEDPWQHASDKQSHGPVKAVVIRCKGCSHCADLNSPSPNDPLSLVLGRIRIVRQFDKWFK